MKKWLIRLALSFVGLAIALVLIGAVAFRLVNHTNGRLVSSGQQRSYLLYVPESYDPAVPTPLVITIHGFAQWPAHQMQLSGWNELADQYGFIVVYPAGTRFPLRWQAASAAGDDTGTNPDVTFISDLIGQIARDYNLDPTRIYANGLSNGGGMSFLLSCALSDRIAAVGMVAGAFLYPWEACSPQRPVPAIAFHGTKDPIVPFQGGPSQRFDLPFPAIPAWMDALARQNGCDKTSQELPSIGDVSGVQFMNCAADVVFYTIAGGGHTWPGGDSLPEWLAGTTTQDIDATRVMWEFFQQNPLPDR